MNSLHLVTKSLQPFILFFSSDDMHETFFVLLPVISSHICYPCYLKAWLQSSASTRPVVAMEEVVVVLVVFSWNLRTYIIALRESVAGGKLRTMMKEKACIFGRVMEAEGEEKRSFSMHVCSCRSNFTHGWSFPFPANNLHLI